MTDIIKEKYEAIKEEVIQEKIEKGRKIQIVRRTVKITNLVAEEGAETERLIVSEIKRYEITSKGTPGIKERMEIPKFGDCVNQKRGTVESGIVRIDGEQRIVDRKKNVFDEGLKQKLRSSGGDITKEELEKKMIEEIEKKRADNAFKPQVYDDRSRGRHEYKETEIKITGFDKRCDEADLKKVFEKVGKVRRCRILRDRLTGNKSWGLGIGDWGLGIGDWAQSPIPNPQSPIPIQILRIILNICKILNNV